MHEPKRILIVDDDHMVRKALVRRVKKMKIADITEAEDGQECLELLAEQSADLVILDIMMPRLDGLQVLKRMRGSGDHTPVLVLTGAAEASMVDEVKALGVSGYMRKPFEVQALTSMLYEILGVEDLEKATQPAS